MKLVSDRLIEFVKTFEELLFDSQKKIRELYDDRYLNKPFNNEATWEDDDRIYKMRISMVSKNKTYCKDCSYSKNEKCYKLNELVELGYGDYELLIGYDSNLAYTGFTDDIEINEKSRKVMVKE